MAAVPPPSPNHARYLVVLALGAFGLPLLTRVARAVGAPEAPTGLAPLLLAAILLVAVLIIRSRDGMTTPELRATPSPEVEDPHARL